jgi:extracellular matrix protein 14
MRLLEAMFPTLVHVVSIGVSYEGRDIPALRVGVPFVGTTASPRKTLVIIGGLHAREWISTSTVNYVAWSFITSYGRMPMVTKFLDHFDLVFIPVMNPDGFEFTWETDRLWRKSRQHTNMRFCRGLDLDHAFGYEWDGFKPQNDPCSESYGGHQPFEAVEALKLSEWARNETENNTQFVGLVDLHSYSQQILYPFSYSCDVDPPNLENLQELAIGLAKAIRLTSGQTYAVTSACEGAVIPVRNEKTCGRPRIESGGGSAIDWFYHELHARYSYQIKLRDTGSYGFLLPRESIVPTGEEIFSATKYLGDYLLGNNGIERAVGSEIDNSEAPPGSPEAVDSLPDLRRRRKR